jgi:hypothetical protein
LCLSLRDATPASDYLPCVAVPEGEEQTVLVAHRNIGSAGGGHIPVGASVVPELKGPRAVEAVHLRQDVPLHGGSENGDMQRGAVPQSLAGKLVVHRSSIGSGGGFVLACGVGLCLHDAERKGLRLSEDRGCNDDDRERNGDSEFHEGSSISDYRVPENGVVGNLPPGMTGVEEFTENPTLQAAATFQSAACLPDWHLGVRAGEERRDRLPPPEASAMNP